MPCLVRSVFVAGSMDHAGRGGCAGKGQHATVYGWVEAGRVHLIDTPRGAPLICPNSLSRVTEKGGAAKAQSPSDQRVYAPTTLTKLNQPWKGELK